MTQEFSQLGLIPHLVQTVTDLGYLNPTPIQEQIIPLMLDGQDVIAQSQTGTGKTAAFVLPILQNLKQGTRDVQALVLSPTRELALQVAKAANEYAAGLNVQVLPVYGGSPYSRQIESLRRGVHIVVGTPGRLLDLIEKGVLHLGAVTTVVLDEADEMLSMGFIDDMEAILKNVPTERQTALFSATLPPEIKRMAGKYMHSPQSVAIKSKHLTVDAIKHQYCLVNEREKLAVLTRLFEVEDITSALIFVKTRIGTSELVNELMKRGYPSEALSGDLEQQTREQVLNRFRLNHTRVVVATDMAARGLDIDDISHVFNYDLPEDPELYVHRVGRTGRAGKTGIAISLLTSKELWRLRRIEGFTKQPITRIPIPTFEEIEKHREALVLEQITGWLKRGGVEKEMQIVAKLVEMGHEPLQIAAVALNMARKDENLRPIAPVSNTQEERAPKARTEIILLHNRRGRKTTTGTIEKGMLRLTLNAGKAQGIKPADVVGTIAYFANIPGSAIGEIVILENNTLVDVSEKFVAQVLAKSVQYKIRKSPVKLERV